MKMRHAMKMRHNIAGVKRRETLVCKARRTDDGGFSLYTVLNRLITYYNAM